MNAGGPTSGEATQREASLDGLFRAERPRLWGLAYRLTGSAIDADDVVQETFTRLLDRPPAPGAAPLGPWLVRVATNLGIDALRRRKRRGYDGPWLPEPIEGADDDWAGALAADEADPERRYGLVESASYAFLVALEALGPRQRAALLLRDVLGCSAREAADLLGTSEANVRVLHLRARSALAGYDARRCPPGPALRERHRVALERLIRCLLAQDADGLRELFTESIRTVTDANGEYTALAKPLVGRDPVARLYLMATLHRQAGDLRFEIRVVNGLPALLVALGRPVRRQAPRSVMRCELDESGRIRLIETLVAPKKLAALRFPS